MRADDNHVNLYRRVVSPDHPGLSSSGWSSRSARSCRWPRSRHTGSRIWSRVRRPAEVLEMRAQIAAYDTELRKRYVASKRHTIQVDFHQVPRRAPQGAAGASASRPDSGLTLG